MGRKIKIENRNAILRAAYCLLIQRGYDDVTTNAVAQEAGLQHRVLFRYFPKKEEMLTELIAVIEFKMIDYIEPYFTDDRFYNFVLYFTARVEFTLIYADYFRLRTDLVKFSKSFLNMFLTILEKIFGEGEDHTLTFDMKSAISYIVGGTQTVQYEYLTRFSARTPTGEHTDFLANYGNNEIPKRAASEYRRCMYFALRHNLRVLGCPSGHEDELLQRARLTLLKANLVGFREYYESGLGFRRTENACQT